jgi:hypothetical protein
MIDSLEDLLGDDGFRTGVVAAAVAGVVVALAAGLIVRRRLPWAGLAFGAAVLAAMATRRSELSEVAADATADVATGAAVLALGVGAAGALIALWAPRARSGPWGSALRVLAAVPGAVIVATAAATDRPGWAFPAVLAVTVIGGELVARCDGAHGGAGTPPVLLAVTACGVYVTTPDTEHAAVMLGAALPLALLGWPRPLASLGTAGSFVTAALVAWIVVLDGAGRDGAVVGALACLGMLVVDPVGRWIAARSRAGPGTPPISARRADLLLVVGHIALVLVCSRVAGLRTSAAVALAIAAVAYVVAASGWAAVARRTSDAGRIDGDAEPAGRALDGRQRVAQRAVVGRPDQRAAVRRSGDVDAERRAQRLDERPGGGAGHFGHRRDRGEAQ